AYAFPFRLWNAAYIFLRAHAFPHSKWRQPLFEPMVPWATVDCIYGEPSWQNNEGFTAAQGVINLIEVPMYL
ncbi:hypothetical protein BU23DRAFT_362941, partial [Bimuria novae-zelandiae CBS 107.79]